MSDELDVRMVPTAQLMPDPGNPRNNTAAVSAVAESIRQFGFKVPLVIDGDNGIIAGHTRYRAALMENIAEVPCVVADDLTEDQKHAFAVAENRTSDFSFFDTEKLSDYVQDIPEELLAGFDVDSLLSAPTSEEDEGVGAVKEPEKRAGLDLAPFEKYQYVMILCRTDHDYMNLTEKLGLENPQKRYVQGNLKRGSSYGRVIEYPEFLEKLREEEL